MKRTQSTDAVWSTNGDGECLLNSIKEDGSSKSIPSTLQTDGKRNYDESMCPVATC
jgi:hypothetical protein